MGVHTHSPPQFYIPFRGLFRPPGSPHGFNIDGAKRLRQQWDAGFYTSPSFMGEQWVHLGDDRTQVSGVNQPLLGSERRARQWGAVGPTVQRVLGSLGN